MRKTFRSRGNFYGRRQSIMTREWVASSMPFNFSRSQPTSDTDIVSQNDSLKSIVSGREQNQKKINNKTGIKKVKIIELPMNPEETQKYENKWTVKFLKCKQNASVMKDTSLSQESSVAIEVSEFSDVNEIKNMNKIDGD